MNEDYKHFMIDERSARMDKVTADFNLAKKELENSSKDSEDFEVLKSNFDNAERVQKEFLLVEGKFMQARDRLTVAKESSFWHIVDERQQIYDSVVEEVKQYFKLHK